MSQTTFTIPTKRSVGEITDVGEELLGREDGRERMRQRKGGKFQHGEAGPEDIRLLREFIGYQERRLEERRKQFERQERFNKVILEKVSQMSSCLQLPLSSSPPESASQGAYNLMPRGSFIEVFPGKRCRISPKSKYGVWGEGYLTRLPWVSRQNEPEKNLIPHVSF